VPNRTLSRNVSLEKNPFYISVDHDVATNITALTFLMMMMMMMMMVHFC
jgi:hypothetical protein